MLTAADQPLQLAEIINIALENSPKTKKAWWEAKRAESEVGAAQSAYYPTLDLTLTAEHGKEFKYINGPDTKYTQLGANLALSLLLFDFGERKSAVAAAKEALKAASWQNNWAIQEVLLEVLQSAYELLHAEDKLAASSRSLDDAKTLVEIAEARTRSGVSPISDLYSSRAALSERQMEVTLLNADLEIKRAKLASKLGLKDESSLKLAPLEELALPEVETEALLSFAKEKRADLLAKQASLKEANLLVEKAESQNLPKLTFNSDGGYNRYTHDHTKSATYEFGLTLDMPLFSGFDSIYKRRVAQASAKMQKEELTELEREIAQEVFEYNLSLNAAKTRMALATTLLTNATEAYEAILAKYKAGKEKMFSEVAATGGELARSRTLLSQVKLEWLVNVAKLAYATGTLPTPLET
jgi:outer membrane protein TolC